MGQWILALCFLGLILLYIYAVSRPHFRNKKLLAKKEAEERDSVGAKVIPIHAPAPDSWVFVKYRGMILPMRAIEKTEIWDNLSRKGRNEQIDAMKKAFKQGRVQQVKLDADTVCYIPMTQDLIKIRDEYNKFKELGGKIIEED